MTIEVLRKKSAGVLEIRNFTMKAKGYKAKEYYFLVKGKDGKYFIGFSEDGSYCCRTIDEEYMVELLNDEEISAVEAMEIYMQSPHLSCWMDD